MKALIFSVGIAALAISAQASGVTVYSTDFQSATVDPQWSTTHLDTTPGTVAHPSDQFLGQFGGSDSTTLTLTGLAPHDAATVSFDLYMIDSPDGNGPAGGNTPSNPDEWFLDQVGVGTLIDTNFANYSGDTQDYPDFTNDPGGPFTNAPYTGATEVDTLGYNFAGGPMNAVYHIVISFQSLGDLSLTFRSAFNQDISDESWGIDNVSVVTNADTFAPPTPEPATFALVGGGLALSGLLKRRKKA